MNVAVAGPVVVTMTESVRIPVEAETQSEDSDEGTEYRRWLSGEGTIMSLLPTKKPENKPPTSPLSPFGLCLVHFTGQRERPEDKQSPSASQGSEQGMPGGDTHRQHPHNLSQFTASKLHAQTGSSKGQLPKKIFFKCLDNSGSLLRKCITGKYFQRERGISELEVKLKLSPKDKMHSRQYCQFGKEAPATKKQEGTIPRVI